MQRWMVWWPVSGQRTDEIKKQADIIDAEPTQTEPSHTAIPFSK